MPDAQSLTLAFLSNHAMEAARVIETLPSTDAAALFAEIPARVGAPVLAAMLPPAAARVLGALADEQALALLNACGTQAAVAMLRHVAEPRRTQQIAGLATVNAVAARVLLGFPEDAVGAWTDPEVIALPLNAQVAAALERLQQGPEPADDAVYLLDAERRMCGYVALRTLVRAPGSMPLANLARPAPAPLSAMMPIAAAAGVPAWERVICLPVVDRAERLVGVLRRAALAQALNSRPARANAGTDASATQLLAAGYWSIVSGLLGATLAALPATRRVLPDE